VAEGRLAGSRAVVTGASRGLGRALAEAFAAEGARVVVTATTARRAEGTVSRLRERGAEAHAVPLDLRDRGSVLEAAAQAVAVLGRVDVLVNNAGLLGERVGLADHPLDLWDEVVAANLTGTFTLTQALIPAISQGGAVITVTSGAAGRAGWGAYGVSKLAIEGVNGMLREELADAGIRFVAVNPGGLRTKMRAAAYPQEDPATVPHPSSVAPAFVAIAAGDDPGPLVDAREWPPR
jgi:NAD(P)-dependent dehydrogenase (short-subunit alcohol dehydrogenase family)